MITDLFKLEIKIIKVQFCLMKIELGVSMQLNIKTDYAMRIVLYLAGTREIASATELSEELKIPRTYVPKVFKGLIDSGIAGSKEGIRGGYYLAKRPSEISLLDVFVSSEPTMKISRCLEAERDCPGQEANECQVMKYYQELQKDMKERLLSRTLDEFL